MKKKYESDGPGLLSRSVFKILRVMKLMMVLICFVGLLSSFGKSYSQNTKLSVEFKNSSIESVLNYIESRTDYSFMYDNKKIDISREINISAKDKTVEAILDQLFENGVTYKMIGKHIIITPKDEQISSATETQQPRAISGRVTDSSGAPLPGVTVVIRGKTTGTITDAEGNFSLPNVPADATLAISFVGMKPLVIKVAGRTSFDVMMVEETVGIDEVVAIGYGKVRKQDISGAIGVIKADKLDAPVNISTAYALQGKIPGVSIQGSAEGQAGAGVNILIRGVGTINGTSPLYMLDNMPIPNINNLNPDDIESIQVLKDASSAAIYGSRAANGVILITTKQGRKGAAKFSLNADYGVQSITKKMDVLNSDEWVKVISEMYKAQPNGTGDADKDGIPNFSDLNYTGHMPSIAINPQLKGKGTDWQDELYRNAPMKNISFSSSGGTDNVAFSTSLSYLDQDGDRILNYYKRLSFRGGLEYTKGRFKIGETILFTKTEQEDCPSSWASVEALMMPPAYQVYNSANVGGFQGSDGRLSWNFNNPIGHTTLERFHADNNSLTMNTFLEFKIIDGLIFRSAYTLTDDRGYRAASIARHNMGTMKTQLLNRGQRSNGMSNFWQFDNTLNYNHFFGKKHSVNAVLGHMANKYKSTDSDMTVEGLPDGIWELSTGTTNKTTNSSSRANGLESYFGRLVYAYDNRYSVTGTFRADGSTKFYKTKRWGNFGGVGMSWNVANEQFFKNLTTPVSVLKLRGSWGQLGNQEIGDYKFYRSLESNTINYFKGNPSTLWTNTIENSIANTNLQWERTATKNLGLDLELWNGKLTYTLDVFNKVTTDMLMSVSGGGLPPSIGISGSDIWINAGKVTNNGYDMQLTWNGHKGDFTYSVTGIFSHVKNMLNELNEGRTVIERSGGIDGNTGTVLFSKTGYPVYGFFLVQTDGLFRSQAEIDAYTKGTTKIQPDAKVGDQKFKDANDDGKIDADDQVYCGNPFPKADYSLRLDASWKFIDFSLYLQGVAGGKIYNTYRVYLESGNFESNYSTSLLNSYTFNPNSDIPRLEANGANNNGMNYSDRWLEDGSYLRLRNVQVGFTLPKNLAKKVSLDRCRLYVAGDNLLTWTKYQGYSPDVIKTGSQAGIGRTWAPAVKTIHVGLQLNF